MFRTRLQSFCAFVFAFLLICSVETLALPVEHTCQALHMTPNDANDALNARKFADATRLFREMLAKYPDSVAAKAGLVRSLASQYRLREAFEAATRFAAESPDDPMIVDALGEAYYRRGEIVEAGAAFSKAAHLDPCYGLTHYDIYRFQRLAGNYLTARKQLDLARQLSPDDAEIVRAWQSSQSRPFSLQDEIRLETFGANNPKATPEQRRLSEGFLKHSKALEQGDCRLVQPVEHAKVKLAPLQSSTGNVFAMGLDIEFNGKRKRLLVDTGAGGLVISKAAAASAGLVPEISFNSYGVGDKGVIGTSSAHVEKLRIGGLEFHNCEVQILDRSENSHDDGLIGLDVFARWLVTLDTPVRELRLDPLPRRPGEDPVADEPLQLRTDILATNEDDGVDNPRDRYIAPEMESWTRVYRSDHYLIFPTSVNQLPIRLFIADTGSTSGLLSPELAKEIGGVAEVNTIIRGISGEVDHVYTVDKQIELNFAGVRQPVRGITVIPLGRATGSVDVEISGFLGFTALRELVLTIDYRDNLVHVVFDPKHGYHGTGDRTF